MKMTDWNEEAELLKKYLAYCIDFRLEDYERTIIYNSTTRAIHKLYIDTGNIFINDREDIEHFHKQPTFDEWKKLPSLIKGNFVWEDGRDSKVIFQADENGRWSILDRAVNLINDMNIALLKSMNK